MTEFSTLPSLLSQLQLPPAPEVPTTVWVALEASGVNWGAIANGAVAFATLFLAGIAAWQARQTNQIIEATNEQAEGLWQQNDILRAQLEIERTHQYPALITTGSELKSVTHTIELVNIGRHNLLVFGAEYITEKQLLSGALPSDLFFWVRQYTREIEIVETSKKDAGNFYVIPHAGRFVVKPGSRVLPCDSRMFLAVAAAYPNLGKVVLVLPLTCNLGVQGIAFSIDGAVEFEPFERFLKRLERS